MLSFIFLSIFLFPLPPSFSDLSADRSALLLLRQSVGGRTLIWNTTTLTPCSWRGVTCNTTINRVTRLQLPGSRLSGQIPPNSIGNLTQLQFLSLRNNSLSGPIPSDLSSCTLLTNIHLQSNRFTGSLPDLDSLLNLRRFNVSFNPLTGPIPSELGNRFQSQSFLGTSLCDRPLSPCSTDKNKNLSAVAGISIGSVIGLASIIFVLFVVWRTYRSRRIRPQRSPSVDSSVTLPEDDKTWKTNLDDDCEIVNVPETRKKVEGKDGLYIFGDINVGMFSLRELLSCPAEMIGKGTVGTTYRVYFENGVTVVVKRLNSVCVSEEVFVSRIEELGSFVHENLEPFIGYFCGQDEKLLPYQAMDNGSLFDFLHGNNIRLMSWEMRGRIALGVARGIEYLHAISSTTTHGNIKSSNIFLTDYYGVRVSEFGLAQLVYSNHDVNGYRAPEVIDMRTVSQEADIYSFGVLILELLMSKVPGEETIELIDWMRSISEKEWRSEVFDPDILRCTFLEDKMVEFLKFALSCTDRCPNDRPTIAEVVQSIEQICSYPFIKNIHTI